MVKILAVNNELAFLSEIKKVLSEFGFDMYVVNHINDAVNMCSEEKYDILIADYNIPGLKGIEFTKEILNIQPDIQIIFISAFATIREVLETIKIGAFDYLDKPINKVELLLCVKRAEDKIKLMAENAFLKHTLGNKDTYKSENYEFEYHTNNEKVQKLFIEAKQAANSDKTVLITGSPGTGKEILARYIHNNSSRKHFPFIVIDCGSLSGQTLESDLFGQLKDEYSGADFDKKGYFEFSGKSTIFFNEIGNLTPQIQKKLVKILQSREFSKAGDTKILTTNARVIASSSCNLAKLVNDELFREDLFYMLNELKFQMPTLNERTEDILYYFDKFINEFSVKHNKNISSIEINLKELLGNYNWTGNFRELKSLAERVVILCDDENITSDLLPLKFFTNNILQMQSNDYSQTKEFVIRNFEVSFINKYLKIHKGNVAATARAINFHPVSLRQKLAKLGIRPERGKYN